MTGEVEKLQAGEACNRCAELMVEIERLQTESLNRGDKIVRSASKVADLRAEVVRLQGLVKMGEAVVNDFLPNIARCALQDYGRMNTFLLEAARVEP